MNDDLVLDGNAFSGLLSEALLADPSELERTCQGCGEEHPLGAHRAYRGAGVVLRCPSCGVAAVLVVVRDEDMTIQARGTFAVARAQLQRRDA